MKRLVGIILLAIIVCIHGELTCREYKLSKPADYKICWEVKNDKIELKLTVATEGWIGFGIGESSSGGMLGSDIAVISNGIIKDMFTTSERVIPKLDSCSGESDWKLQTYSQSNGKTTTTLTRKLQATDFTTDRSIEPGMTRVVLAYGLSSELSYHVTSRVPVGIPFIELPKSIGKEGETEVVFKINNYKLPAKRTLYACQEFDIVDIFPEMETQTYHATSMATVPIENGGYDPHHVLLYACSERPSQLGVARACGNNPCRELVYAWAVGGNRLHLPAEAGLPVGGKDGSRYFSMEFHYDNPALLTVTDNSYITMQVTSIPRLHEAQVLWVGDPLVALSRLSSGIKPNTTTSYQVDCLSSCTSRFTQSVTVINIFLHMHNIGKRIRLEHHRNGKKLTDLGRSDYYDFNLQHEIASSATLNPGDTLSTYCEFYNDGDDDVTFGAGTPDEMCMAFVLVYPKVMNSAMCGLASCDGGIDYTNTAIGEKTSPSPTQSYVPLEKIDFGSADGCRVNTTTFHSEIGCKNTEKVLKFDYSIAGITIHSVSTSRNTDQTVTVKYRTDNWLALGKSSSNYIHGSRAMENSQTIFFFSNGTVQERLLQTGSVGSYSIDSFFTVLHTSVDSGIRTVVVHSTSPAVFIEEDVYTLLAWSGSPDLSYHGVNRLASKPSIHSFKCESASRSTLETLIMFIVVGVVIML